MAAIRSLLVDMFQSLLHQGISLLGITGPATEADLTTFQSLLHQGISLLLSLYAMCRSAISSVSIPSSSGHQFTECDHNAWVMLIEHEVSIPSSSGHQFTEGRDLPQGRDLDVVSIPSSSGHQFTGGPGLQAGQILPPCFNPFFIRASVYCPAPRASVRMSDICVSIPSSSGHQFTGDERPDSRLSRGACFNPFFIRASVYCLSNIVDACVNLDKEFQSLLHQGISLLDALHVLDHVAVAGVSIPSSSGHQFTACRACQPPSWIVSVSIPSSSGHQFTAS